MFLSISDSCLCLGYIWAHPDIRPDCRALPGLRGLVHVEYSVRDRFPKVAMWEERGDPSPKIRKPASLLGNNVGIDT